MIAKVTLDLFIEVQDGAQAEAACHALSSLDSFIAPSFPAGDPLHTDIQIWKEATAAEIREHGLEEG